MAEWARLLSECWVKPVAGSNPALPATRRTRPQGRVLFSVAPPYWGDNISQMETISNPTSPATKKHSLREVYYSPPPLSKQEVFRYNKST